MDPEDPYHSGRAAEERKGGDCRVGERHDSEYGPGIEISPMTLIWFTLGVRATLRASVAIGLHASNREAPNTRYVSTLSLLSLHIMIMFEHAHAYANEWSGPIDRTWTVGTY